MMIMNNLFLGQFRILWIGLFLVIFVQSFQKSIFSKFRLTKLINTQPYQTKFFDNSHQEESQEPSISATVTIDSNLCIGCKACTWICPRSFNMRGFKAQVQNQPLDISDHIMTYAASLSCPVDAISSSSNFSFIPNYFPDGMIFPAMIEEDLLPNVYHLGYHSLDTFGASSYFLQRPNGNVMIDCPRYDDE